MSKPNFHFIVPVWGTTYTKLFIDVCLPMLITPGNLREFGQTSDDQFVIVTTWADKVDIESSASFWRLKKQIQVEFVLIDGIVDYGNTHAAMSECYAMAMRRECIIPGGTYFVFLTPDSFWPDGTFRELAALSRQNVRVAMAAGLRLNSEAMVKILRSRIGRFPDNPAIPIDELARLALDNLHQQSEALNVLSRKGFLNCWPSHMYWINPKDYQLVAHCFHLHPLMVLAPKSVVKIGTTIDGEFLNNLHYSLDQYHILGGEFIALELSPSNRDWGQPLGAPSIPSIEWFSLLHANSQHWHFFRQRIFLNGSPGKPFDPFLEQLVNSTVETIQRKRIVARLIQIFHLRRVVANISRLKFRRLRNLFRQLLT